MNVVRFRRGFPHGTRTVSGGRGGGRTSEFHGKSLENGVIALNCYPGVSNVDEGINMCVVHQMAVKPHVPSASAGRC